MSFLTQTPHIQHLPHHKPGALNLIENFGPVLVHLNSPFLSELVIRAIMVLNYLIKFSTKSSKTVKIPSLVNARGCGPLPSGIVLVRINGNSHLQTQ